MTSSILKIHKLVDSDNYPEALRLIDSLRGGNDSSPILDFYEAMCRYEEGDDNECLRLLASFIEAEPDHLKFNYAVFTAAICLLNLHMEEEAAKLLKLLPAAYPDLQKEKKSVKEALGKKSAALAESSKVLKILESKKVPLARKSKAAR